jgi:flagellar protein FlaF
MPVGELIAAAVGLILIIIVAYVLVGSTIGTAETMASAQRDMTHLQEIRLHTDIAISPITSIITSLNMPFTITITNTGIETINLQNVDFFIINQTTNTSTLSSSVSGNGILNPKEAISVSITDPNNGDICGGTPPSPYSIEIVTGNGIYNFSDFTC